MEENYGVVPCTMMSMLSNKLMPSACETDITGLIGMYAMVLASGKPSALLDWNNNYGDDPDKAVVFHCSNLPQDIFGNKAVMDYQEIIAGTRGQGEHLRHAGGADQAHHRHLLPRLHRRL